MIEALFGKRLTPEDMVKKWRTSIRAQERMLEKQIRAIETEEQKSADRKDLKTCKLLAREIVRSRKAKDKIYTSKAQLNSMIMQLQQQVATLKIAGSLQKSTEMMKLVNGLVKLPQLSKDMQEMSMEMMKAGIIEEMINDTMELQDEDDLEDEANVEVDKVLLELTQGIMGGAGVVGASLNEVEVAEPEELDDMRSKLEALRN